MPNVDRHPAGALCWIELATSDQDGAKGFYRAVFGWSPNDNPIGSGEVYTIFRLNGRDAAAAYRKTDVPPHWMLYIAVDNADETVNRIKEAGGTVIAGPFDVMDFGRMAVAQDPTGAYFSVWQAKSHAGIRVEGDPNTLCWADLNTPDRERARDFYTKVFGWEIGPGEKEHEDYWHIQNSGRFIGGIPPCRQTGAPPHWLIYFAASSCDATAEKARAAGARFYMEPTSMPDVGRLAVLADPQGAAFAIFEPAKK